MVYVIVTENVRDSNKDVFLFLNEPDRNEEVFDLIEDFISRFCCRYILEDKFDEYTVAISSLKEDLERAISSGSIGPLVDSYNNLVCTNSHWREYSIELFEKEIL